MDMVLSEGLFSRVGTLPMEKPVPHLMPTALLKNRISVASMHLPFGHKEADDVSSDVELGRV